MRILTVFYAAVENPGHALFMNEARYHAWFDTQAAAEAAITLDAPLPGKAERGQFFFAPRAGKHSMRVCETRADADISELIQCTNDIATPWEPAAGDDITVYPVGFSDALVLDHPGPIVRKRFATRELAEAYAAEKSAQMLEWEPEDRINCNYLVMDPETFSVKGAADVDAVRQSIVEHYARLMEP